MATIKVEIVSAEKQLFSGESNMVVVPGVEGEIGVMPGHAPLLTGLRPGVLKLVRDGDEELFYVAGGLLEVQPDKVTVLADVAERSSEIDEERAMKAREEAEAMLQSGGADIDYAKVQAELAQAVAQLELLRKLRKRK